MAEERNLSGSPRRKPLLIGLVIALLLAVGAILLPSMGDDGPSRTPAPGDDEPAENDGPVAVPSFRFATSQRLLVPTGTGRIKQRERVAGRRAAEEVRDLLTDL